MIDPVLWYRVYTCSMETQVTKKFTIGSLAKAADVGVETVRFYERKGLLEQPRKTSAFRTYSQDDARKIKFIKRAQDLGFTLNETKELMEMEVCSKSTRPTLKTKAEKKIKEVKQKIEDLKRMQTSLKKFAKACGTKNSSTQECGLLSCFENNWDCC